MAPQRFILSAVFCGVLSLPLRVEAASSQRLIVFHTSDRLPPPECKNERIVVSDAAGVQTHVISGLATPGCMPPTLDVDEATGRIVYVQETGKTPTGDRTHRICVSESGKSPTCSPLDTALPMGIRVGPHGEIIYSASVCGAGGCHPEIRLLSLQGKVLSSQTPDFVYSDTGELRSNLTPMSWASDGQTVYIPYSEKSRRGEAFDLSGSIAALDTRTWKLKKKYEAAFWGEAFAFSHDRKFIGYLAADAKRGFGLWVLDLNTGKSRLVYRLKVADETAYALSRPQWSPDDGKILIPDLRAPAATAGGPQWSMTVADLTIVDLRTGKAKRLPSPGPLLQAVFEWGWFSTDKIALKLGETIDQASPRALYSQNLDGSGRRRIADDGTILGFIFKPTK